MRIFLDTEFNEFKGDLISMALVAEDGCEFYEALECPNPGPWVAVHVMPILNKDPVSLTTFQEKLCRFLAPYQNVHVVADWPEDIAHFCNALITGPGVRIGTPPLTTEILRIDASSRLPHNALEDARGIMEAVLTDEFNRVWQKCTECGGLYNTQRWDHGRNSEHHTCTCVPF